VNIRSPWAIVGAVLALVVAVNLGLRAVDRATRAPGGPVSSSFATAPEGAAAYAELLARFGRPVARLRERPADADLDPRATVVVLDPQGLRSDDGAALRRFVERGGRLVAGGAPDPWLGRILPDAPGWSPDAQDRAVATGVPGVRDLRTGGEGVWTGSSGRVLARAGAAPLLLERRLGSGRALLLADASPLQNRLLGRADNAALGLALAGGRPVAFVESAHGYGPASGLDAIPARWWWVFGALCLSALALALARGRRLGPPELPDRELPPARVEFAEALAIQLAKVRPRADAEATARRVVRERLARELRLSPDATDEALRAAARARGWRAEDVEAALGGDLFELGGALERLEREEAIV